MHQNPDKYNNIPTHTKPTEPTKTKPQTHTNDKGDKAHKHINKQMNAHIQT